MKNSYFLWLALLGFLSLPLCYIQKAAQYIYKNAALIYLLGLSVFTLGQGLKMMTWFTVMGKFLVTDVSAFLIGVTLLGMLLYYKKSWDDRINALILTVLVGVSSFLVLIQSPQAENPWVWGWFLQMILLIPASAIYWTKQFIGNTKEVFSW